MAEHKFPLPTKQYIHGEYVDSLGTERLTLHSAVDGSLVSDELSCAGAEDVDRAVESAQKALKEWQALSTEQRRSIMLKYADLIMEHAPRLGYLEAVLVGKGMAFGAGWEPSMCAELFRYFAGYIDKQEGDCFPSNHDGFLRIVHNEPLGVCAAINAFNSPMITFGMKAAPALAAGNVIINKASEMNPFSTLALGELAIEAGFPKGALNVIVGAAAAGQALSSHMKIRKISFTGSVAVGKKIQIAATQSNLKRVTLELGGKSPVLVFDDADLDLAVSEASNFLALNGQGCVLGTRVYVHESIAEKFVAGLKMRVEGYASTLGSDPHEMTTMSSPMYHERQKTTVMGHIEQAKKEAQLITGGDSWGDKGHWVQPTIFYKPIDGAQIVSQEVFGPVIVVDTFATEDEVLHKANDTEYGLGAAVYTKDINRALRVTTALEAGTVTVNTSASFHVTVPFGGYKGVSCYIGSGIGRENGKYVLREYSQSKSVIIKYT
ncbi:MAG: hypothetical protein M1818_001824 [Claussenomyces sp. TS43310]|nr:MAG: hypothetical protein M1818_001824 [Claussenomyces sp. TS43310]